MGKLEDDILYREIFMSNKSSGGGGGITPTGTKEINITENGTVTEDVTNYASANIVTNIEPYGVGNIAISRNGSHDVSGKATAVVNVPIPDGYVKPRGTKYVYDNGEYNVTKYANVNVDVDVDTDLYGISDDLIMGTITDYSSDSLYEVGDYAFFNCTELTSFKCPNVSKIGEHAFAYCRNLADFDFSSVETIDTYAFDNCLAFKSCTLNVAKTINDYAFNFCPYLKNISLPELAEIGQGVFTGCDNLEYIKIGSQDSTIVATADFGNPISDDEHYTCPKIYVADSLIDEYRNATNWNLISDNIYPLSEFTE